VRSRRAGGDSAAEIQNTCRLRDDLAVVSEKEQVLVTYMLARIENGCAKAVIMATPKFITRRIVETCRQSRARPCINS